MKYLIGLYFLIIGTFILKTLITERKNDKIKEQKVKDIIGFSIVDGEVYDIEYIEEAEIQMTSIQKEYYNNNNNNIPIIIQGRTKDIERKANNIELRIIGNRSFSIYCFFNIDANLLNIRISERIKIKGNLKLNGFFISLEKCEVID